jgi:hypothetical protein
MRQKGEGGREGKREGGRTFSRSGDTASSVETESESPFLTNSRASTHFKFTDLGISGSLLLLVKLLERGFTSSVVAAKAELSLVVLVSVMGVEADEVNEIEARLSGIL